MDKTLHDVLVVLICAIVTIIMRLIPFFLFSRKNKKTPKLVEFLSSYLPFSVIGVMIIYSMDFTEFSLNLILPQIIGIVIVIALYLWKKNSVISIIGGTAIYMILVQLVF